MIEQMLSVALVLLMTNSCGVVLGAATNQRMRAMAEKNTLKYLAFVFALAYGVGLFAAILGALGLLGSLTWGAALIIFAFVSAAVGACALPRNVAK